MEEILNEIDSLTKEILEKLEIDIEPEIEEVEEEEGNYVKVSIDGESASELIGYHGKTMASLQYVLNLSFNKNKEEEDRVRIVVNINNYKNQREEYLKSLAGQALVNVLDSNQPITLPPMRPAERRIIHMELQRDNRIKTESIGEEPNRSIVVSLNN